MGKKNAMGGAVRRRIARGGGAARLEPAVRLSCRRAVFAIAAWPWGAYLGEDAVSQGVRMKISSWTRHDHNTMPPASKTTGNYANSTLAKMERSIWMRAGGGVTRAR